MSTPDLPCEIWVEIFQHLSKRDVHTSTLVCKSWLAAAAQMLYKEVELRGVDIVLLRSKLSQDQDDSFKQHGRWVETINIYNDDEHDYGIEGKAEFEPAELHTLFSRTPNLKKFNLKSSNHSRFYLKYLQDMNSSLLPHLGEIAVDNITRIGNYEELVFLACLNFCDTLTHLKINYRGQSYTTKDGSTGDAFTFLRRFQKLTHLEFENFYVEDLEIYKILEMLPNLVSLQFTSRFDIPSTPATDIDPSSCFNSIKSLDLSLPTLPISYTKVLTSCLPNDLETFKIYMSNENFFDWIERTGVDLAMSFATRLSKGKSVVFSTVGGGHIEEESDDDIEEEREEENVVEEARKRRPPQYKINTFYSYLGTLKGNRKLNNCHSTYSEVSPGRDDIHIAFTSSSNLVFDYAVTYYGDDDYDIPLPDNTMMGPEAINSLRFVVDRNIKTISSSILEFALSKCPHLNELQIDYYKSSFLFIADSAHYSDPPASTTQENLTHIRLQRASLTQDMLDLLSKYLPNVEDFDCSTRYFDEEDTFSDDTALNLTGLKKLNNFSFDIGNVIYGKFDHLFIHFKYSSDQEEAYYDISPSQPEETEEIEKTEESEQPEEPEQYDMEEEEPRINLTCSPTTLAFVNQCREDSNLYVKSITFECNKINSFIIQHDNFPCDDTIAEFKLGQLQERPSTLEEDDYL